MNIILVSGKLTRARTLTLSSPHLVLGAAAVLLSVLVLAFGLQYFMLRYASGLNSPLLKTLILSVQQEHNEKMQSYLRENLNAMASKLGQMQAQLLRLDTLGERLARTAGFKPQEFMFDQAPARGGAASTLPTYDLSFGDLGRQVELLIRQMDDRTEKLGILDSLMIIDSAKKKLLPSVLPVQGGWYSSNFGWRIDPFSGTRAFHEGVDFMAEVGTAAHAAAGGVVAYSDFHPQYGNMIEIDHGNGLITRYAHLSKRMVKMGDVVLSGGRIGDVGSTGRTTGPHLHFEVRQNGAPLNPARFLRLPG
ncbi:MAG: M23 family metallopeptidase [Betaproteobacteria bacterium]|nr:M23 family metallopeptidase [Betaproteobacteria bacterium]